ncbi:MAG: hypothetical protein ACOH2M_08550 [Cypionkella sp.]
MADPNLADFYSNVARFEKRRQKGFAFEAGNTLVTRKPVRTKHRSFLRPLLMIAVCGFGLKGMIYQSVGATVYGQRVEELQAGQGMDRLGGWLMQVDPVTRMVADGIARGLTYLPK